jgi:predicted SAM-dependent methyltransferase
LELNPKQVQSRLEQPASEGGVLVAYQLPFRQGQALLELGGGERPLIRPNLDVRALPTVDIVADFNQPLPIEDGTYDGLFSSYVLEHVSWRKVRNLVAEASRILKPNGIAVFVIPNTKAQFLWALEHDEWDEKISQCVFGDQDYPENSHKVAFSPDFAVELFRQSGFCDVITLPHGELRTDMIVEAKKAPDSPSTWTDQQRKKAYDRHYFNGGTGSVGGYAKLGYWDYPIHWITHNKIMERSPQSVLEVGCARGYLLKRLEDSSIRVKGLEISDHCWITRAVEDVVTWDITKTPWPIKDKEFDLGLSVATLEHIPENKIKDVMRELERTCKRGLHGIDFGGKDDGFDKTHCLMRDKSWWALVLPTGHEIVDKEELERGSQLQLTDLPPSDGKIKVNVGSFRTMFNGWINIDQHPLQAFASNWGYDYRQYDVRNGLLFTSGSVDLVFASHFLEHLTYEEGAAFLKECWRVMKDGAVIRLLVPDAGRLIRNYTENKLSQFDELNDGCAETALEANKLWSILLAGHSAIYDSPSLVGALKTAGFKTVKECKFRESLSQQIIRETLDLYPTLSLFVDAVK